MSDLTKIGYRQEMAKAERDSDRATGILSGRNPVREGLSRHPKSIEKVMVQKGSEGGSAVAEICKLARAEGVQVQFVPSAVLSRFGKRSEHQGVVAIATDYSYWDLDDMLSSVGPTREDVLREIPLLVILDHLQDVHNFGAIVRSCAGAGVAGIIVPSSRMAPISSATRKASAGMLDSVKIARTASLESAVHNLKERGYWVYGTDAEGESSIYEADWSRPIALVIGSEGSGLSAKMKAACDQFVAVPLEQGVESLNVSVAAGIVLFTARFLQRRS